MNIHRIISRCIEQINKIISQGFTLTFFYLASNHEKI